MEKLQYQKMFELEDIHWWFLAKREFVKTVLPLSGKHLKILDIGSGTGGMTKFVSQYGDVTSVETSVYALPYLQKRKIKYLFSSIYTCKFQKESFDAICLFDVLYHQDIKNDEQLLNNIYSWLKPNGVVCITDCAIPLLTSHHDLIMHARTRYWLGDLTKKLEQKKFLVKKASYIYFFTFPFFIITRLVDKVIPLDTVSILPSWLNSLLFIISKVESNLLRLMNFPLGSSIIIVAQKP